jgi:hypothetical protein
MRSKHFALPDDADRTMQSGVHDEPSRVLHTRAIFERSQAMDKQESGAERDLKNPQTGKATMGATGTTTDASNATGDAGYGDGSSERTPGTVGRALRATESAGSGMVGGVTHVATDLVHGVGTVGGEMVAVIRDTANTAIAGVGSIGETAVHTVAGLISDLVGGVRDIGASAMRGRSNGGESESPGASDEAGGSHAMRPPERQSREARP